MAPTALPPDVEYGYVSDRILRAVLDTPNDPDELPDGVPAQGTVTITPVLKVMSADEGRVTVIKDPYTFSIHQGAAETTPGAEADSELKGLLVNPATGHTGPQAVVAGWYDVTYSVDGTVQGVPQLHITPEYTRESPMWIRQHAALIPVPSERWVVNEFVYHQTIAARDEVLAILEDLPDEPLTPAQVEQIVADYLAANPPTFDLPDHEHDIDEVAGLQDALDGKQAAGDYTTTTDLTQALADYATTSEVADSLAGKADAVHDHPQYLVEDDPRLPTYEPPDLSGYATVEALNDGLAGKADTGHNHDGVYATVGHNHDGVYAAIDDPRLSDARTPTQHSHSIAQVTGLQSSLDGKADAARLGNVNTFAYGTTLPGSGTEGDVFFLIDSAG